MHVLERRECFLIFFSQILFSFSIAASCAFQRMSKTRAMHAHMKEKILEKSDAELVIELKKAVSEERKFTALVLKKLKEIYLRKIHLLRGYASLHEFCVKELGYSD